jgi:hypothetical protein
MKTPTKLLAVALVSVLALICIAGTKVSQMRRTTTVNSNDLYNLVRYGADGRKTNLSIEARYLGPGLGPWITNSGGGVGSANLQTNPTHFGASLVLTLKDGLELTNLVSRGTMFFPSGSSGIVNSNSGYRRRVAEWDSNQLLAPVDEVDDVEIRYLDGVTSAIQTQFGTLGTRATNLEGATNGLTTRVTNLAGATNGLTTRATALETRASNLEGATNGLTIGTSNNVQIAAGSSISVSSAGSSGVMTHTIASTALVTNVTSLSASNVTSKPILHGIVNRTAQLMGIEAGANITLTPNGTNLSISAASGALSDGDKGDVTVSSAGTVWSIDNDSITDAMFRESAGFSIIGKATTGTGNPTDITAGTDTVLGRSGSGNLGFAQVASGQIASDAVTYAKIQNVTTERLLGRSSPGSGDTEELAIGTGLWLNGGTLSLNSTGLTLYGGVTIEGLISSTNLTARLNTTINTNGGTVGRDITSLTFSNGTDTASPIVVAGHSNATTTANISFNIPVTAGTGHLVRSNAPALRDADFLGLSQFSGPIEGTSLNLAPGGLTNNGDSSFGGDVDIDGSLSVDGSATFNSYVTNNGPVIETQDSATLTGTNRWLNGALGNEFTNTFVYHLNSGVTNVLVENIADGQTIKFRVFPEPGVNVIFPQFTNKWVGGVTLAAATNVWSEFSIHRHGTTTNIQGETGELLVAVASPLVIGTNFATTTATVAIGPGNVSNLISSSIDFPANNVVSNVGQIKFNLQQPGITVSNLVISPNTNRWMVRGLTNVVFTNLVEEAGTSGDISIYVHNTTAVTMGLVWPAYGSQHGYHFKTNANNPVLTYTSLATGLSGVASFSWYDTNWVGTWIALP